MRCLGNALDEVKARGGPKEQILADDGSRGSPEVARNEVLLGDKRQRVLRGWNSSWQLFLYSSS